MNDVPNEQVALARFDERLGWLRLQRPEVMGAMEASLRQRGQLTPVVAWREGDRLTLVDGFKRVTAARRLGWPSVWTRVLEVVGVEAKAALLLLNEAEGLSELEQGWLVRSLYREDRLTQPEIGVLLGRHKSWVCRRLMLVEQLDESVEAELRLGLVAARTAVGLARLPRGNQEEALRVVQRRGLTTAQTDQLVEAFLAAPDATARGAVLTEWSSRPSAPARGQHPRPSVATPGQKLLADMASLSRAAVRLEARLLERPLDTLGEAAAAAIRTNLAELGSVLAPLLRAMQQTLGEEEAIQ